MEKVLYEYGFDLSEYLLNLIPLIVGIGFFATSISIIKAKKRGEDVRGFHPAFFKVAGFIVGPLGVLLFLISTLGMAVEHIEYKELLETNNICYVEGYVENFHPMPYEGHDTEHFEIDGIYFEYTDFEIMNGYNTTSSHGGVVTQNGQYLKIKYIVSEYDIGESRNIILYIAEIEKTQ